MLSAYIACCRLGILFGRVGSSCNAILKSRGGNNGLFWCTFRGYADDGRGQASELDSSRAISEKRCNEIGCARPAVGGVEVE